MKLLLVTQKVDKNDQILGFFHRWILEFSKHFDKSTVICLEKGEYDFPGSIKVLSLGKEDGVSRTKYILRFYKYIWQERKNYDVVLVHMNPIYVTMGGVMWKLLRKPIALWYTHKSVDQNLKVANYFASVIFTASKESFRLESKKVKITGHGIDSDYFKPGDIKVVDNQLNLITVGRISLVKDYETIIRAVKILVDSKKPVHLSIVGGPARPEDGEYLKSLQSLVKELEIGSHVEFVGPVGPDKILTHYQDADVFISASNTGSLDKAIFEAMSCGLIVVGSNDALKEIYKNRNDRYFSSGNYHKLAEIIMNLNLNNDELKDEIQDFRDFVAHHSLRHLIKRLSWELISLCK